MFSNKQIKKNFTNRISLSAFIVTVFLVMIMMPQQNCRATTPQQDTQFLMIEIQNMNLPPAVFISWNAKLEVALRILNDRNINNNVAAIHILESLIKDLERQSGNLLTYEEEDYLIALIKEINFKINCILNGDCPYCGGNPCIPPCDGTGGGGGI